MIRNHFDSTYSIRFNQIRTLVSNNWNLIKLFSSREPIYDFGVHAHLRRIARRWVWREDRQHTAGWRRVRNDFHRSSGERDECKLSRTDKFELFSLSLRVQQVENSLSTYEPHACIIVYSIVQRSSLRCAEETLNYLWRENVTKDKAVIVVGNKADLARSRVITTSGNGWAFAIKTLVLLV